MTPYVLVLSTASETLAIRVQKALLGDVHVQDRSAASFTIDCKYYTADIGLRVLISPEREQDTISTAEAIIVCFEFTQPASWEAACHWQTKASDYGTPIRLLVCSEMPADDETRSTVYRHALQNHFEVIELDPSAVDDDADEEFGLPRLRAALEAHQWPGLRLKAQNAGNSREVKSQHHKEPISDILHSPERPASEKQKAGRKQESQEDFDSLFSQLLEIKSKAANMDVNERRKLAEKNFTRSYRTHAEADKRRPQMPLLSSDPPFTCAIQKSSISKKKHGSIYRFNRRPLTGKGFSDKRLCVCMGMYQQADRCSLGDAKILEGSGW